MPAKTVSVVAAEVAAIQKTQSFFKQLASSAADLNAASDELSDVVSCLDEALKRLNLGVSAWVTITQHSNDGDYYWTRDLGYSKVGNKWGLTLRYVSGNSNRPEQEETEIWLFADAPRWLRIDAVDKIPDLLEHLVKQADHATKRLRKKTAEARALTDAINEIAAQPGAESW